MPSPTPTPAAPPPQKPDYLTVEGAIHVCTEEGAELAHRLIKDAIAAPNYDDIFHAIRALEATLRKGCPDLNKKNPSLAAKHKQKIMEAQWMVLERLLPEEVEVLFTESLEHLFEHDNDEVMYGLRRILQAVVVDFEQRDAEKKKWREAMAQSQAQIGTQPMIVNGISMKPTVQHWLKLWREFIGDRAPDSLQVVEFMNSTTPVSALSDDERKKLEQLLKLQIELLKSSLTPEGNEEKLTFVDPVTGTFKTYERGQVFDTGVKAPPEDVEDMRAVYNVDEHGRPRSDAQALKHSVLMRYASPELFEQKEEPVEPLPPKPATITASARTPQASLQQKPKQPVIARPSSTHLPQMPKQSMPPKPLLQPAPPTQTPKEPTPRTLSAVTIDHAVIAQRVLAAHKLLLPSIELEHRFLGIITSYLKGVRDVMEARVALTATPEEGGVNMTATQAEAVLETADEALEQWEQHPEKQRSYAPKTPPPTPTLEMIRKRLEEQKSEKKRSQSQQPRTTSMGEPIDIFGSSDTSAVQPSPTALPSQPPTPQQPAPRPTVMPARGKQPAVMGPVDELKQLTANEFRMFGTEARTASRVIIEKIHLLEQESIEKKAEAISAWKSSPLHQLYLDIGNQSLESTLPVEAVIKQREKNTQPTLTVEEFDAVADINRQLRF